MNMVVVSVLAFIFAIGVLVAVHEWGHYIVARILGVKVLRFSVGFGRPIWMRRGGVDQTEYCISSIPLGGYVKLLDEREGPVAEHERGRSFNRQPIASRIAILVAGPLMNFLFAVLAFWFMFQAGVPGLAPVVGKVAPDSVAAAAGFHENDRIVAVNGRSVATWEGALLGLLDGLLEDSRISLQVSGDLNGNDERVLWLDAGDRLSELTEPGALLPGLGLETWSPTLAPVLGEVESDGSAASAGMIAGDRVLSAAGLDISDWAGWVEFVRARPGQRVQISVLRQGVPVDMALSIGSFKEDNGNTVGRIGARVEIPGDPYEGFRAEQRYTGLKALEKAVERTWSMSVLTVRMVVRMVSGDVSAKNISGPINIAQYAGYAASVGWSSFLSFLAVVSLSLGIINLLPIPVLDGGQVVYQLAEAIKGKPLSERVQVIGQQIGMVLLVLIMSVAFYNDLSRFFS
jgi:regulator of sigma E protease